MRQDLLQGFPAYAPSRALPDPSFLKLDSGENLWAPNFGTNNSLYPDSQVLKLREELSADFGVPIESIVVGNGSDELIDLVCRLFISPGDKVIDFPPAFPMFSLFAKLSRGQVISVKRTNSFDVDLVKARIAMQDAKLTFLDNPNNPTGTLLSREKILELLQIGTPLVVDEAYFEFCGETVIDLVEKFENLIVLRTFSKWAGIAGLRVGVMIANPKVIKALMRIKAPYNVNAVGQEAALKVLQNKEKFLPVLKTLCNSRDWFVMEVNRIPGFRAIPSRASSVTVVLEKFEAKIVAQRLFEAKILVKVLPESLISNALRISIAPRQEMQRVVDVLRTI